MGPTSTLVGVFILNALMADAVELLAKRGIAVDVYQSANMQDADASANDMIRRWQTRIGAVGSSGRRTYSPVFHRRSPTHTGAHLIPPSGKRPPPPSPIRHLHPIDERTHRHHPHTNTPPPIPQTKSIPPHHQKNIKNPPKITHQPSSNIYHAILHNTPISPSPPPPAKFYQPPSTETPIEHKRSHIRRTADKHAPRPASR